MRKKKVVLLTDSLTSGGAQKQIALLGKYLSQSNKYTVHYIYYYEFNFFKSLLNSSDNDEIDFIFIRSRNKVLRAIEIVAKLKKINPHTIISFLHGPNFYSFLYKFIFFWKKVVHLSGERNLDVKKFKLRDYLVRIPHLFSNKIICNSGQQAKKLETIFKSKVYFIPNGLELEAYPSKKSYEINKDEIRLIIPARFAPQKNAEILIELLVVFKNIKLFWYGETFDDSSYSKKYKNKINDLNLSERFIFRPPTKNIHHLICESDALIMPSFYEGCCNSIIEGMLCGIPIFASNVSDNPLYLSQQKELLFNPHSKDELFRSIIYFINLSDNKRESIGLLNKKKAENYFSVDTFCDSFKKLMR